MIRQYKHYLLLCLLLLFTACASPFIEVEARYWNPDLSLDGKVEENNIGADVDFVDDLGIDDEKFPGGSVYLYTGDSSFLRADYVPIDYDSDDIITKQIEFNGQIYTAGTRVLTDFEMRYLRLGWGWYFIDTDIVRIGSLIEAKIFDIDMALKAPIAALDEAEDFVFGLPTVGGIIEVNPIDMLSIYGEISGIMAGSYGHMFDAQAGVKFIPIDYVTVSAGYRLFNIDVEVQDNEADLMLAGPFISASVRF